MSAFSCSDKAQKLCGVEACQQGDKFADALTTGVWAICFLDLGFFLNQELALGVILFVLILARRKQCRCLLFVVWQVVFVKLITVLAVNCRQNVHESDVSQGADGEQKSEADPPVELR